MAHNHLWNFTAAPLFALEVYGLRLQVTSVRISSAPLMTNERFPLAEGWRAVNERRDKFVESVKEAGKSNSLYAPNSNIDAPLWFGDRYTTDNETLDMSAKHSTCQFE